MAYEASKQTSNLAVTGDTTVSIPAGYFIENIIIQNSTGNIVLGGVKVGTSSGAIDVCIGVAVGANDFFVVPEATILKRIFSMSASQTLYIQAVTGWNSASLNLYFVLTRIV